jgi:hypothetical protein
MMEIKLASKMDERRERAESFVNERINIQAIQSAHQDHEYKIKREIAINLIADNTASVPQEFNDEAALMKITPIELAKLIVAKPDNVLARGLRRRADVLAIRNANTPGEIEAILLKYSAGGES